MNKYFLTEDQLAIQDAIAATRLKGVPNNLEFRGELTKDPRFIKGGGGLQGVGDVVTALLGVGAAQALGLGGAGGAGDDRNR